METYILHIYRRENTVPEKGRSRLVDRVAILGVLEEAGTQRKVIFHDMDELWELLAWHAGDDD